MTHASLFSGIGGFDLAAEWMGWTNVLNCEIDEFCRKVLKYHFPNAKQYADIRTTDFTVWRDRIDVLTGGFPCQPFSVAGKRKGTDDDRYLWPEMLRAIREIRPRWIVGENVRGLINWSGGMVLEQVCADLEDEGYEVQPFVIPACAVNAPHRRDRVWIAAYCADTGPQNMRERPKSTDADHDAADTDGHRFGKRTSQQKPFEQCQRTADSCIHGPQRDVADIWRSGRYKIGIHDELLAKSSQGTGRTVESGRANSSFDGWRGFPTESPVRGGNDGLSDRLDGIAVSAWCRESIKAYGNAVVPQLVTVIFRVIEEYEKQKSTEVH